MTDLHLPAAGAAQDQAPRHRCRSPPGMTEPNENGRRYRHGTLTAYNAAKCRCEHCRAAYADYRTSRRAGGKDSPRTPRALDTDGHIPAGWFRHQVWLPARKAAGLSNVRVHDLRHAHASWLVWRGGPAGRQGTPRSRKHRHH